MAEAVRYVCSNCGRGIEAWSDGNPYYIDDSGQKQHAYHPDYENLDRCIGNDVPHLCLACGEEFNVDSRNPARHCPKCLESEVTNTYELEGKSCPYCMEGNFSLDPEFHCIS